MIENKEKIYEIILTIAVFFFLLFNISILRTYFVYAVYVGDLIYLLLFFLEFIVSFLLSYKFYKTIQSKLSSRIKDILLTVFVTIVFYAYLLVFWIFILAMFSKIAPYIPNVLGAILSLILIMLIPMSFLFTLFLSYRFYLYVELYKVLKAQEKNFLKRDQEQTIKYYEHNSQLRDKWNSQKTKFLLAYVIAVIIILAINSFLSLGIDLGLLLKGFFILSIGIFLLIYDKKVFAYFMIIFGWMGLVFLFNSLGHNGFLGLTVNQTDAISGVLLVVGTTIAIVVATFWLKYNV